MNSIEIYKKHWRKCGNFIATQALKEIDEETYDIFILLSRLCKVCSESDTPIKLTDRVLEIVEAIERDNKLNDRVKVARQKLIDQARDNMVKLLPANFDNPP
jgi:hypothetical protein